MGPSPRQRPGRDATEPGFGFAESGLGGFLRAQLVGQAPAFVTALAAIESAARCEGTVLIEGRTGVGKEVAARAIHYGGRRASGPFVPVNCGAIADGVLESELFGHVRGAFTDARADRLGLVAEAHGGTLFLDEIDSLSLRGQVSLLRFLQDRAFRPVGGAQCSADVRVLAATNCDLAAAVEAGRFREDLLWRLAVLHLRVPTLAERPGDAALLALHFLERAAHRDGRAPPRLSPATLERIEAHDWPGNVRELQNYVERVLALGEAAPLTILPVKGARQAVPPAAPEAEWPAFHAARARTLAAFERDYLVRTLRAAGGNVTRAAAMAGTERRTLGRMLKRHGLRLGVSDPV